jgi:Cu+-exporting ATPase
MDGSTIGVLVVAALAILGVNVWFLGPRAASVARARGGVQEVRVTVRGGYEPSRIRVHAGRPVRLVFRREETEGCSDTVLLPEWDIVQALPAHVDTPVTFTPRTPGSFPFMCGMHMLRGTIEVA